MAISLIYIIKYSNNIPKQDNNIPEQDNNTPKQTNNTPKQTNNTRSVMTFLNPLYEHFSESDFMENKDTESNTDSNTDSKNDRNSVSQYMDVL